ncbi:MAG: tetratricopeptide repeat protein, partial [Cyclobacteriaceae bacterium]
MIRILYIGFIILLSCSQAFGQKEAYKYDYKYDFENSKAEKLFKKARQAYIFDYDYATILEIEEDLVKTFLDKKDTVAANIYAWLADSYYYELNDEKKFLELLVKEYELRKSLGDKGAIANSMVNLGYTYDQLGYYKEAEALFSGALEIEKEKFGEKSAEYAETALYLLEHYVFTEDVVKGLELAKTLIKTYKGDNYNSAITLKYMGDLEEISGDKSKALKTFAKALELFSEEGMMPSLEYGTVLASIAGTYSKMGKYPQAEEIYDKAISMFERLEGYNEEFINAANTGYGLVSINLGNFQKAEDIYLKNLVLDEELYGKESFNYALDAANLANCYMYWEKYPKALEYNQIAADIYRDILGEESINYAITLQTKALIYTKTARPEEAISAGKEALRITKAVTKSDYEIGYATFKLADAYFAFGDLEKAENLHKEALDLVEKSSGKTHPNYARSTTKLAILNWKKKETKRALRFYDQTFENYFTQINTVFPVLSEAEKAKFFYNNLKPAFEQYNSFIVETSLDEKSLIGKMYNNQLATKGLILYATNKVRDAINSSGDSTVINKYRLWIEQKEQLAQLFSAGDMPVEERNEKIDELTNSSNELEKELSIASKEFAATFSNKEYTWEDVRDKLNPGEAAVEIVRFRDFTPDSGGMFTDEVYYAALIVTPESKDYPEMVLLRNGEKMETRFLSNYRNAIKYKVKENYSYNLFWKPIANKLEGVKKVFFSPDGVYNQISIYTLRNPASSNFTIDEMEIQLVTNTKDLVAYEPRDLSDNPSYLFGFPNYNMGELESEDKGEDADNRGMSRGGERGARGARGGAGKEDFEEMSRSGSIPRGL